MVWDGPAPLDEELIFALDQLVFAYHQTPESAPADVKIDPPREDGAALYAATSQRFPHYGLYRIADPLADFDQELMVTDAIDDLADITLEMREVLWRYENNGVDDAHWLFRLQFFHWGLHARQLALYLYARQWG